MKEHSVIVLLGHASSPFLHANSRASTRVAVDFAVVGERVDVGVIGGGAFRVAEESSSAAPAREPVRVERVHAPLPAPAPARLSKGSVPGRGLQLDSWWRRRPWRDRDFD